MRLRRSVSFSLLLVSALLMRRLYWLSRFLHLELSLQEYQSMQARSCSYAFWQSRQLSSQFLPFFLVSRSITCQKGQVISKPDCRESFSMEASRVSLCCVIAWSIEFTFAFTILAFASSSIFLNFFFSSCRDDYFSPIELRSKNFAISAILRSVFCQNQARLSSRRSEEPIVPSKYSVNLAEHEVSTRWAYALQTWSQLFSISGRSPLLMAWQKKLHISISMLGLQDLPLNDFLLTCENTLARSCATSSRNSGRRSASDRLESFCSFASSSVGLIRMKQSLSLKKFTSSSRTLFLRWACSDLVGCILSAFSRYQVGVMGLSLASTSLSAKSLTSQRKLGKHLIISSMSREPFELSSLPRLTTSERLETAFSSMLPMLLQMKQLESSSAIRNTLMSAFSPYSSEPRPSVSITTQCSTSPLGCGTSTSSGQIQRPLVQALMVGPTSNPELRESSTRFSIKLLPVRYFPTTEMMASCRTRSDQPCSNAAATGLSLSCRSRSKEISCTGLTSIDMNQRSGLQMASLPIDYDSRRGELPQGLDQAGLPQGLPRQPAAREGSRGNGARSGCPQKGPL